MAESFRNSQSFINISETDKADSDCDNFIIYYIRVKFLLLTVICFFHCKVEYHVIMVMIFKNIKLNHPSVTHIHTQDNSFVSKQSNMYEYVNKIQRQSH